MRAVECTRARTHASTNTQTHTNTDTHSHAHANTVIPGGRVCAHARARVRMWSLPTQCALPWIHSFFLPPVWMRNSDAEFSFPICSICGGSEMLALIAGCVCNSCDINLHAVVSCVVLCYQRTVHVAAKTSVSLLLAQFLCCLLSVNHPLPSPTLAAPRESEKKFTSNARGAAAASTPHKEQLARGLWHISCNP